MERKKREMKKLIVVRNLLALSILIIFPFQSNTPTLPYTEIGKFGIGTALPIMSMDSSIVTTFSPRCSALTIYSTSGKTLSLRIFDDTLVVLGNLSLDSAATIFINSLEKARDTYMQQLQEAPSIIRNEPAVKI